LRSPTHRQALALLAGALLVLFGPSLVRDRVVYPHDNTQESGQLASEPLGPPSNRRYSDASHYYLPALAQQLQGHNAGWISTWDPHVELGKPSVQLYGLSKAFLPTRVLSWISDDPLRVYSWSAVLAVTLACLFGFLLLSALELHPAACLTGALGLGLGSLTMYALCFTLFLWGVCWTAALCWCTTLFVRRPSAWSGLGLAGFTNALLLSAYPQFIVWQAYLLGGYALLGLLRHGGGGRTALARGLGLVACVLAGALGALPVYWDLLEDARRSTRLAFDPEFFARILPNLETWADRGAFVASALHAGAFGSPAAESYPAARAEPFLLPLWSALAAAGIALVERRRSWPILACAGACLLLSVWPDAYVTAVRSLGFGLSRSVPLRLAHLPLVVLAALAADRALAADARRARLAGACVLGATLVGGLGLALAGLPIDVTSVAFAALIVVGTLGLLFTRRPWLATLLALASALVHGPTLQVFRAREDVCLDSPLLRLIRAEAGASARFAWVGANVGDHLAPNQEALFGLRSIHSYNPLFSKEYQDWAARYRQTQVRGTHDRRFLSVIRLEDFLRESAALAATTVFVSLSPQQAAGLKPLQFSGPFHLYRLEAPALNELQTRAFTALDAHAVRLERPLALLPAPERALDLDEKKLFQLAPQPHETLLFLSQQYHPRWTASANGRTLATVLVDGLFQGVRVPPGTEQVELVFRAAARWSWIPQASCAGLVLALLARQLVRRSRASEHGVAEPITAL
jgi:hypothetical protein